jgi:DNA modification methylase
VIKTELTEWKKFQYLQQPDFKEWDKEAKARLVKSILENDFSQPFYVWQDPSDGVIYCLDGRHRTLGLEEIAKNGTEVPQLLPATFIHCDNLQEAAKLVLIYSSIYAKVTQQGLFDFIKFFDLEYDTLKLEMDIPEFSTDRFEQKFDLFNVMDAEGEEELPEEDDTPVIVQKGDIFELNGHRIACGSFKNAELLLQLMEGRKARIVNCDPPYNIPLSLFKEDTDHDDFEEGKGELTDDQFVEYLEALMRTALEHTVPGAIHYIFMDWRHIWHMTEAGRRVYGSPQPKQLCVWNKEQMANGSFYRAKHELIFIYKSGGDEVKHLSHLDLKDRIRTNVWDYAGVNSIGNPDRYLLEDHPTPKPVAMIADSILDTTNPGDLIIDFFLGSGTSLIAAEQTDRLCYSTEIKPKYVQQGIKRYLNFCEKKGIAVTFNHLNGTLTLNDFLHETIEQRT